MSFTDGFMAAFFGDEAEEEDVVVEEEEDAGVATPRRRQQQRRQRHTSLALPPEVEEGRVEYKRKLSHPSPERYRKLVTQLHWRLGEGARMALYELGVEDSGEVAGLDAADLQASLATLRRMAHDLDAETTVLRTVDVGGGRTAVEVLVRRVPRTPHFTEVRVALVGGANAGKSTLLGVLTRGEVDNGRGKARRCLLNHRHELASGQTSSVSHEVLGFTEDGRVLTSASDTATWAGICEQSARVVTLIDLAGQEKYLHTTVRGLTSRNPDLACLVIGARAGVTRMTEYALALCTHRVTETDGERERAREYVCLFVCLFVCLCVCVCACVSE
jgi:GTPase